MGKYLHNLKMTNNNESNEVDTSSCSGAVEITFDEGDDSSKAETAASTGYSRRSNNRKIDSCMLWLRILVTATIIVVITLLPIYIYRYLANEQTEQCEKDFQYAANSMAISVLHQQGQLRQALNTLATTITAGAVSSDSEWPFFTLPLFESIASQTLIGSGIESIVVANLVQPTKQEDWLMYTKMKHENKSVEGHLIKYNNLEQLTPTGYHPYPTKLVDESFIEETEPTTLFATWSSSPPPTTYDIINWNLYSVVDFQTALDAMIILKNETIVTKATNYASFFTKRLSQSANNNSLMAKTNHPSSVYFHPILKGLGSNKSQVVATVAAVFNWETALQGTLPDQIKGIHAEIKNDCNQSYTYLVDGSSATFVGEGSLHDPKYSDKVVAVNLAIHDHPTIDSTPGHCQFSLYIYPSSSFNEDYVTNLPTGIAFLVFFALALLVMVFLVNQVLSRAQKRKFIEIESRTRAIFSSILPDQIRERLLNQESSETGNNYASERPERKLKNRNRSDSLRNFLTEGVNDPLRDKPLADLFLDTTVLFADLVGFTAWCSVREPTQVFTLLETLFCRFDEIALRRRVFKVETVGDCYVAVSGLPEPRKDHALMMARFALDIMAKMEQLTTEMEVTLGPDTGYLSLRIGMHSGPVTAGVLRGERARFQLFGDTMNTTSRIESTGESGRIHMSQETADLLIKAGKESWLEQRKDKIEAKGKGLLTTYWLRTPEEKALSSKIATLGEPDACFDDRVVEASCTERSVRLVEWNVEILVKLLKQIIALRNAKEVAKNQSVTGVHMQEILPANGSFLDEVTDIISLPEFDGATAELMQDPEQLDIPDEVVTQVRDYVIGISSMYRDNAFHNFMHASHVMMSVMKLLSRIVAPSEIDEASQLHDHTYGITSDPLTQFACAFGALIHDVDHTGVPNDQLVAEGQSVAIRFKNRSVAEQNSLELSWQLLLDDRFIDLRKALMPTPEEYKRFRQLVVNIVMATDIVDKDLKSRRNERWDKAFHPDTLPCPRDQVNRKATIVIEHLIQASDVSHTMQHWQIYRQWNERFFKECYMAYLSGRAKKDPSEYWYEGEIGFFDFYIIPLARKLKECGVFGKSSSEYLDYATRNRSEWEIKGRAVVAEMVESIRKTI